MAKPYYLMTILFLIPIFAGCQRSEQKPWDGVKALELLEKQPPAGNETMTVGLHIYLLRIKTDNLADIQDQIAKTDAMPVQYNDSDAFNANGLIACRGDAGNWENISSLIAQASATAKKHINLLIAENLGNDVVIADAVGPVSIIYRSNGQTSGIGFDAGRIVLRLNVSSLMGLRQACRLDIVPVYQVGEKGSEFVFDSSAFNARLDPGQFILLAPAQERQSQNESQTLGNIISYGQSPEGTADLCFITCNLINKPL